MSFNQQALMAKVKTTHKPCINQIMNTFKGMVSWDLNPTYWVCKNIVFHIENYSRGDGKHPWNIQGLFCELQTTGPHDRTD